jgi:homoaconitase/3-isopropylmalate dehydratase large subunit
VLKLEPKVALPHYVENGSKVKEIKDLKVDIVVLGTYTKGASLPKARL